MKSKYEKRAYRHFDTPSSLSFFCRKENRLLDLIVGTGSPVGILLRDHEIVVVCLSLRNH